MSLLLCSNGSVKTPIPRFINWNLEKSGIFDLQDNNKIEVFIILKWFFFIGNIYSKKSVKDEMLFLSFNHQDLMQPRSPSCPQSCIWQHFFAAFLSMREHFPGQWRPVRGFCCKEQERCCCWSTLPEGKDHLLEQSVHNIYLK